MNKRFFSRIHNYRNLLIICGLVGAVVYLLNINYYYSSEHKEHARNLKHMYESVNNYKNDENKIKPNIKQQAFYEPEQVERIQSQHHHHEHRQYHHEVHVHQEVNNVENLIDENEIDKKLKVNEKKEIDQVKQEFKKEQKNEYHENNQSQQHVEQQDVNSNSQQVQQVQENVNSNSQEIQPTSVDIESQIVNETELRETLSKLEKIVHLDLKGAPPKLSYLQEFIPFIRKYGATGVLLEYEDTFPFTGQLSIVRHGDAYNKSEVKIILELCEKNNLKIMPLVQTYGHLEWLLKHKKFAHLREVSEFPQVITPCLKESYSIIFEMIDQVIAMHPNVPYFHIGCDEVYHKLSHPNCTIDTVNGTDVKMFESFDKGYLSHINIIARYVRKKLPNVKVIIWDDMLHNIPMETLKSYKKEMKKNHIEPMMWAYSKNIERWYRSDSIEMFGKIFGKVWAASAYKGASGELTVITDLYERYPNNAGWGRLIHKLMKNNMLNFTGIAITGWSRYDHFLSLCDLLPQAIPSLLYSLHALKFGETGDKDAVISQQTNCSARIPWHIDEVPQFPITCEFPGHRIYETIVEIADRISRADKAIEFAKKYMTDFSINYNYVHNSRAKECYDQLKDAYTGLINYKQLFEDACKNIYWEETINEWLAVYFIPKVDELYEFIKKIEKSMNQKTWEPRPLKIKTKHYPTLVR